MNCEKCGKEHDGSFGSGRFCNSYCARSFSTQKNRKEINIALSKSIKSSERFKNAVAARTGKSDIERYGIEKALKIKEKRLTALKNHFGDLYPFVYGSDSSSVKLRLHKEITECQSCGLTQWKDKPISLELHHLDGDNQNNIKENVLLLCPNCHSQTENFRNKNRKTKIAESDLVEALKQSKLNIRQALLSVKLSAKGKNYERCQALIIKYKLDMEP